MSPLGEFHDSGGMVDTKIQIPSHSEKTVRERVVVVESRLKLPEMTCCRKVHRRKRCDVLGLETSQRVIAEQ